MDPLPVLEGRKGHALTRPERGLVIAKYQKTIRKESSFQTAPMQFRKYAGGQPMV
jgi:hypothetical protein